MITYRKTRDEKWVAFGPAGEVRVGTVTVEKRDGSRKTEQVVSLGRPFTADGRQCVYGYLAPKTSGVSMVSKSVLTSTKSRPRSKCRGCHGPLRDAPHHAAMEGYCGQCAFDEFDC